MDTAATTTTVTTDTGTTGSTAPAPCGCHGITGRQNILFVLSVLLYVSVITGIFFYIYRGK